MLPRSDAVQAILKQPLDYLHPSRGALPPLFVGRKVRALLNQSLLRGLELECPEPDEIAHNRWSELWVRHWHRLPNIARLMGGQLIRSHLAYGARLCELDMPARSFACLDLGCHLSMTLSEKDGLEHSLSALGLGALSAWHLHIPEALMQRLPLQFTPRVVEMQQAMPDQMPNPSLFILAVQHARIYQNSH